MRRMMYPAWLAAFAVAAVATSPCAAKEQQKVTISYVVAPKAPLPEGLKAVAVIDSGVKTAGVQQDDREKKWSTIAADMVEAMLQNGSFYGSPLAVANRRETSRVLQEQDLKLAGLVDAPTASRVGKLLDVQALVTSRITVKIDVQKGTASTIDWVSIMGGVVDQMTETRQRNTVPPPPPKPRVYRDPRYASDPRLYYSRSLRYVDPRYVKQRQPQPQSVQRGYPPMPGRPVPPPGYTTIEQTNRTRAAGGGLTLATKDVQEISRHLTVQCVFAMIDATTGQAIVQYAPPPYQKKDEAKPDFFFGGNIDESDLDPVDQFIGELVERATQEFVSYLVPVRVQTGYELVGRGKQGEAGIRALRADDYPAALAAFERWYNEDRDEPEALFCMGVTCELMGDYRRALDCYRQAAAHKEAGKDRLPVYMGAKTRLTDQIGRILPPQPTVIIQGQPQPVEPQQQEQQTPMVFIREGANTPAGKNGN